MRPSSNTSATGGCKTGCKVIRTGQEQSRSSSMLRDSDVFVFPSKFLDSKGFPNSVSEAMAVGLPVVASTVGAIPEMIDVGQGGYLAAPDDIRSYAEALIRLRDDTSERTRMGAYNRQKALREYDYDTVVKKLCNVYTRST